MIKRQTITAILAGVAAITLISVLAYRLGLRHSGTHPAGHFTAQSPEGGCVDFQRAGEHTGENTCVSGRVLRVFTSRAGNSFLDFCSDYRQCPFTSVIFADHRRQFGNLATLEGRKVEIVGTITTYKGRAEIIIRDPRQIRIVP